MKVLVVVVLVVLGFWLMRVLRSGRRGTKALPRAGRQRRPLEDLTPEERNARDQRIAGGVAKKWKKGIV